MKILFLTNNLDITFPLCEWIRQEEEVVLYEESISAWQFSENNVFYDIDFIISYNYTHIIKQDVISLFPHKIINLHISMLPWNRGASPNIWSFLEATPSGVTIHEVDEGIDTGDILLQQEIFFNFNTETLKGAYKKSHALINKLFCENWNKIKNGLIKPTPQSKTEGSIHFKKDSIKFERILNYDDTIEDFIWKYNDFQLRYKR